MSWFGKKEKTQEEVKQDNQKFVVKQYPTQADHERLSKEAKEKLKGKQK